MLEAFGPVVLLLALGVMLGRAGVMPDRSAEVLNQVVIWVCLPAAILLHVPSSLTWSPALVWLAAIPWALTLLTFVLVRSLSRVLAFDRSTEGALLMTAALGNTSFLGYPVVRALLGQDALADAIVYDQLGSFLLLTTYGSLVLARYGSGAPPTPTALVLRVVRFPPFVALLLAIGVGLSGTRLPTLLARPIELCAEAMLPLVLIALGLGIEVRLPLAMRKPLALGLGIKLVLSPLLVLVSLRLAGLGGQAAEVALLESAMPPMVTAGVLAAGAGLSPKLSIAMTGLGVLVAILTLPLWTWFAHSLP